MHVSGGLVGNGEGMNRWTFFSTHGIVPRGLEDAGVEKTTSAPAKAAAIPCRSNERGVCKGRHGRDGRDCEWSCPVRPQRPSPLDDSSCNGRTARAATVCAAWMGWRMGWMDGWDGWIGCSCRCIGAPSLQSQQSAHDRDEERGLPQPKTAHTESTAARRRVAQTTTKGKGFVCMEGIARFYGPSQHDVQPLTK